MPPADLGGNVGDANNFNMISKTHKLILGKGGLRMRFSTSDLPVGRSTFMIYTTEKKVGEKSKGMGRDTTYFLEASPCDGLIGN